MPSMLSPEIGVAAGLELLPRPGSGHLEQHLSHLGVADPRVAGGRAVSPRRGRGSAGSRRPRGAGRCRRGRRACAGSRTPAARRRRAAAAGARRSAAAPGVSAARGSVRVRASAPAPRASAPLPIRSVVLSRAARAPLGVRDGRAAPGGRERARDGPGANSNRSLGARSRIPPGSAAAATWGLTEIRHVPPSSATTSSLKAAPEPLVCTNSTGSPARSEAATSTGANPGQDGLELRLGDDGVGGAVTPRGNGTARPCHPRAPTRVRRA
jgi:hypothetical protein